MKISAQFFLASIISLTVCTGICYSQKKDSVLLWLRVTKGDTYTVSLQISADGNVNQKSFIEMITGELLLEVGDQSKADRHNLKFTLNHFTINISSDSGGVLFSLDTKDSTKRRSGKDSLFFEESKNIVGLRFWEELNDHAEPLRTNLDTVIKKLKADKAILGITTAICEQVLSAVSFSENPVSVGETWKGLGWQNTEGKVLSMNSVFTLNALHDSIAEISSSHKAWGNVPDGNELHTTITGEHKINILSGLPMESHFITELTASGSLKMAGSTKATLRIVKNK